MRRRRTAIVLDIGFRAGWLALLWLLITGFDPAALAFGAVAVAASVAVSVYLLPAPQPRLPLAPTMRFLALAIKSVGEGGYFVARRALVRRERIADPGYVRQRVEGAEDPGLLALAYARSLSPGTVAARTERDELELHALDRQEGRKSSGRLERSVRDIGRRLTERRAAWRR